MMVIVVTGMVLMTIMSPTSMMTVAAVVVVGLLPSRMMDAYVRQCVDTMN